MYKEGDILTLENDWRGEHCVFILHKVHNEDWIEAHAKYSFIFEKLGIGAGNTSTNVKYSTGYLRKANDTERDYLLGIMKDKGYSYDFKKNKLLHSFNYKKEEIKINEHCKHYFLGFCHFYLGGCCSGIKCEYK